MTAPSRLEPETKRLVLKVRPCGGGAWLLVEPGGLQEQLEAWSDEDCDEEGYEMHTLMMTQSEIDALGEFNGW